MYRIALLAACLVLAALPARPARAGQLLVFAASSLTEALDAVNAGYREAEVVVSYAGSSTLARQIEAGAEADVFISANPEWMDVLESEGLLAAGSRKNLLENRIVVVGHRDAAPLPSFKALVEALGEQRLAVALTEAVPAGIYAREALTNAGLWDALKPRLAETDNVRAALQLVAWGEAPYGIVYATDAAASPDVVVVWTIDDTLHAPIRYPVAATARADAAAGGYLAYLGTPEVAEIFARFGFTAAE